MAHVRTASYFDHLSTFLTLCALATGCVATIHTDQHVIGWLGENVNLPCKFTYPDVLALYWTNSSGGGKATYFQEKPHNFDGRFNLNDDFSIDIRNLSVSDEGRYQCRLELQSGTSYINHTELTIYASPSMPQIEQCVHGSTGNKSQRFCIVETSNTYPFNMNCRVTGFRPNVTLEWTSSGIVKQPLGHPFQRTLPNGTAEREVTISVTAKLDEVQNYTCTVRGEATNRTDWSTTVTVLVPPVPTVPDNELPVGGKVVIAIFVILVIICIVLVATCVIMLGLRRKKKLHPKGEAILSHVPFLRTLFLPEPEPNPEAVKLEHRREELSSLREKLRDYTFEPPEGCSVKSAHIGLFGEMSAGKSSFLNSLEFAFTGQFKQSQVIGGMESGGGKTISRTLLTVTGSISLFDNRGMNDFQPSNLTEILAQLRGERGPDIEEIVRSDDEEVHCGVFVFRISDFNRRPGIEFIGAFAKELRKYNGYPPMIVITHAASLDDEEREDIKTELGVHDVHENVWFFENYTKDNSTEDEEKSIELLKFLDAALKHCKLTIVHTERKKNVTAVKPKKEKKKRPEEFQSTSDNTTAKTDDKSRCCCS
eukprot:XP_011669205.1 PREDICTED: uncharacterized protein LOC100890593 isoform X3 [Strongylocentrotus purpuratus]